MAFSVYDTSVAHTIEELTSTLRFAQ